MLMREVETENAMSRKSEPSYQAQDLPPQDFTPQDVTPLDITALGKRASGDENGGTAIKYALIAAGIGAAVAATVFSLGTTTAGLYQGVANLF
jgi:Flp pilus assembly pilin Flp